MASPGQIHVFSEGKDFVTALLFNFDIDQDFLKPEHQNWLRGKVVDIIKQGGSLWLAGITSRSGPDDWNQSLSRRRADALTNFLRIQTLWPFRGFKVAWDAAWGESFAKYAGVKDDTEDEFYRGVLLSAWTQPTPPPPPKPPAPKPIKIDPVYVWRHTRQTFFLDDKVEDLPMGGEDRRAEAIARAVRAATQASFDVSPVDVALGRFDQLWTMNEVKVTRRSDTAKALAKYTSTWLDFEYTWGPDKGKRVRSVNGGYKEITPDEAEDWLLHPLKTYRRKFGI